MSAKDLTLNIAVNLGRVSKWAMEGKKARIEQFLEETEEYLRELEKADKNPRFIKTMDLFKTNFYLLKKNTEFNKDWAEDALTWANILIHRSKIA